MASPFDQFDPFFDATRFLREVEDSMRLRESIRAASDRFEAATRPLLEETIRPLFGETIRLHQEHAAILAQSVTDTVRQIQQQADMVTAAVVAHTTLICSL